MIDVSEIQTLDHDVLVVGAGGAGLRAAIACSAHGLSTGVVSKSLLGKAHTATTSAGAARPPSASSASAASSSPSTSS